MNALISCPWKAWPDTFAERASKGDWVAYPWLRYISERVTPGIIRGNGRYLVTAPPQHGKSQFISNWLPTWYLHNFPRKRVILASYAADYANKWGMLVRENLTMNELAAIPMRSDTKSKKRFMTQYGGGMITAGIGGPVTGESAELFIIDDPFKNYQDAMSRTMRQKVMDWYKSVARTRLQKEATVIILHTRWHEDDLIGQLSTEARWEHIDFAATCQDPEKDPLKREVGQALCPERYDEKSLKDLETDLGPMIWDALFQQNPVNQGGNLVQTDWIKFYDEVPKDLEETAIFADLAYKDKEENDYTVVECWGRKGPDMYLIAQKRAHMKFPAQIDALMDMVTFYPDAFHKEIEEKANGAALIQVVKEAVAGIIANNPKTSKEARLASVSPLYRSGNVYYPNPNSHPWVKVNIKEITKFPKADHDDTVDVASMAVSHLGRLSSTIAKLTALGKW